MGRNLRYESALFQFAAAGSRLQSRWQADSPEKAARLAAWLRALTLQHAVPDRLRLSWSGPIPGEHSIDFGPARFYVRGDTPVHAQLQRAHGYLSPDDPVMAGNQRFFDEALQVAVAAARLCEPAAIAPLADSPLLAAPGADDRRKAAEESFHDDWAAHEDLGTIDVRQRNEACTAPEMRYLRDALGDLEGKELLDVGCGLGEASVYFALRGARVTATDVSPGMCAAARRLAEREGVTLETVVSAAEDLRLGDRRFDVIYLGNTLHHVDIKATLDRLLPCLHEGGTFVSWDPVAYNPLINIYRRIATRVRTPDEHPLRLRDILAIRSRFASSEVRWFWLTTLVIFVCMVLVQFRNPNRVRFWKKVIDEAGTWRWLYLPLEKLDRVLLAALPPLRPLCWNVVIVGRSPLPQTRRSDG